MTVWRKALLGDCCEIVSGATPSTAVDDYWDGDTCWATPKDLSSLDGHYISDTPRKLTEAGLASCSVTILPPNSVLFSSRAPIGHVAINTVPMATNQGFKSLVPGPEVDAKFLFHWLRANRSFLEGLGVGATFKEVSKAVVTKVEIPLPPLAEQRRIAAILDKADALRTKRREALTQLERLAQSIFVEMFGDPLTNPKGWRRLQLGAIFDIARGGSPRPIDDYITDASDGVNWVMIGDTEHGGKYILSTRKKIRPEGVKRSRFVKSGDFLLTNSMSFGRPYILKTNGCIHDGWLVLSPQIADFNADYFYTLLGSQAVFTEFSRRAAGATVKNLNIDLVSGVEVAVPPLVEQREFAKTVEAVEAMKSRGESSARQLDSLFGSLQARAFSGEL